jgi:hypothetical protein
MGLPAEVSQEIGGRKRREEDRVHASFSTIRHVPEVDPRRGASGCFVRQQRGGSGRSGGREGAPLGPEGDREIHPATDPLQHALSQERLDHIARGRGAELRHELGPGYPALSGALPARPGGSALESREGPWISMHQRG